MDERIVRRMATPAIRPPTIMTPLRVRAIRDGLSLVGVALLALIAVSAAGGDAHAYWSFSAGHPYAGVVGTSDAFLYSPPAALSLLPLHLLPWQIFRLLVCAVEFGALVYLVGPWALAFSALYPVAMEFSGSPAESVGALTC